MKKEILIFTTSFMILTLMGCSSKIIHLANDNLDVRNRDIISINSTTNTLVLNSKIGDGIAIIKGLEFDDGIIELELKGENNPGKSFVGIAFNIQNDTTYEAIYFRPFNFKSDEKIRREHSVQYIYHPKYSWRFLRTNFEGQFEAEYPRQPSPEYWFGIQVKIDDKKVYVYDKKTNTELLSIKRLTHQVSNRIGLWTGYNSKGEFRNLKIRK
ncbi:hypothetical protein [Changchengzhania lutea]|uniref:hypothetical protein n=1 Tax=Changchengzhania lutea TaxID=2049305 RepID=UPI00115CD7FB|nr:hypothetical protein [Changchengzhania lutea]